MATRGPKPTPTHLKLVKGNPGKRTLNKREARPPPAEPMPPAWLSDDAKVEWGRQMGALMRCGLMTEIDRAAFAAYCQAYGRWAQAERAITKMGEKDLLTGALMIKTSNGNAVQNPLVGTANRSMELMLRAAAEFGMTPSARSRIDVEIRDPAPASKQGADRFFSR